MSDNDFEAGKRAGAITAIKEQQIKHDERLNNHDTRLTTLEKVHYGFVGIMLLITFYKEFLGFING